MQVEIFSDVVCPWCYIGKRRFEAALHRFSHADDVTITYRSFALDPSAPARSTESVEQHLATKYGRTIEQAREMNQRVTDLAAGVGLEFHLEKAQRANTFDAHRLLHLAATRERQAELAERLLDAYFTQGALVSEHAELTELAVAAGLDRAEAAASPGCRSSCSTARTECPVLRRPRCSAMCWTACGPRRTNGRRRTEGAPQRANGVGTVVLAQRVSGSDGRSRKLRMTDSPQAVDQSRTSCAESANRTRAARGSDAATNSPLSGAVTASNSPSRIKTGSLPVVGVCTASGAAATFQLRQSPSKKGACGLKASTTSGSSGSTARPAAIMSSLPIVAAASAQNTPSASP
jgi:2-hydroxychromene-2-carboxylate isomerase